MATPQKLAELGVLYWKLDADSYKEDYQKDPRLMAIRKARNYSYTVSAPVVALLCDNVITHAQVWLQA